MNSDHQVMAELRELVTSFPKEPFLDRPRRPNGYRKMPEYCQWQQDTAAHKDRIHQWHRRNIRIVEPAADRLEVHVAGRPLPAYSAYWRPDGAIHIPPQQPWRRGQEDMALLDLPTQPLELPGPSQNLDNFLRSNAGRKAESRRWELRSAVAGHFRADREPHPCLELTDTRYLIHDLNREYLERLRQRVDYSRLTRLSHLAGGNGSRPWNLLDYDLIIRCGAVLEATAATSPGAVACWLYWWLESWPEETGKSLELPRHPGMIIQAVRDRCRESRPQAWKALAAMPAPQARQMLRQQRNANSALSYRAPDNWELLLWTAERLRAAAGRRKPAAANPPASKPPPPAPEPGQLNLPAQLPPTDKPAAALPAQPPAPPLSPDPAFTQWLLRFRYSPATIEPEREPEDPRRPHDIRSAPTPEAWQAAERRSQALDHFAELALAHFGSLKLERAYPEQRALRRFQAALGDIVDYCRHEPAAALQKRSYGSLRKASHRWHQDAIIRRITAELEQMEAAVAAEYKAAAAQGIDLPPWDQPWPCPLTEYRQGEWSARLLATPQELFKESIVMRHCIGASRYRSSAAAGRIRVFHLQPDHPEEDAPPSQTPEVLARRYGSTLELENRQAAAPAAMPRWTIAQHRSHLNNMPVAAAEKFAAAVAAALNQAEAAQGQANNAANPNPATAHDELPDD